MSAFTLAKYYDQYIKKFGTKWDFLRVAFKNEKKHTIREDKHDRWHAGRLIHPVVFNRSKNQFQFAPAFPCVSTQKIRIWHHDGGLEIFIDDHYLNEKQFESLAKNDGFNSIEDFENWFEKDFTGKIIHWTSLKY